MEKLQKTANEKLSGIYKILNVKSGNFYIGKTIDFEKRKYQHIRDLKNNKHHSFILQRAWNKYNEEDFIFEIIFECIPEEFYLVKLENYFIKNLNPKYNIQQTVLYSKIYHGEVYSKQLTNKDVIEIKKLLNKNELSNKEIAHIYKVKEFTINTIISGQCWSKVGGEVKRDVGKLISKKFKGKAIDSRNFSKLNWEKVNEIRNLYNNQSDLDVLSEKYNIIKYTLQRLLQNRIWVDTNYTPKLKKRCVFLTKEEKIEIIKMRDLGYTIKYICEFFGNRAKNTITNIIKNRHEVL